MAQCNQQRWQQLYQRHIHAAGYEIDAAQCVIVDEFARIDTGLKSTNHQAKTAVPTMLSTIVSTMASTWKHWLNLASTREPTGTTTYQESCQGLYLYGAVGRGKTFLMDLFCEHASAPVYRVHFHYFMQEVHQRLRQLSVENPLTIIARDFSDQYRVLCLDEFMVNDITDAMLLYQLLDSLISQGVVIITTTNIAPDDLYRGGLQRERFLPAIALIKDTMVIHAIDNGQDYRRLSVAKSPRFFNTHETDSQAQLTAIAEQINHGLTVSHEGQIIIENRPITYQQQSAEMIWFDFSQLCEGPRSQHDYIALAKQFPVIFLTNIPVLDRDQEEAAKRFLLLIDVLYDQQILLFLSSAAPIEQIYQGKKLAFEFARLQSRLAEMQQATYSQNNR